MFEFRRPAPIDALPALLEAMRADDRRELSFLSRGEPLMALKNALAESVYSFCAADARGPVAIGGLCPKAPVPIVWMVGVTSRFEQQKKAFLRASRTEVRAMHELGDEYRAFVDRRWVKSLRWLSWLGFREVGEFNYRGRSGKIMEHRVDG